MLGLETGTKAIRASASNTDKYFMVNGLNDSGR